MKMGFNEGTSLGCKGHTLLADLEACEKYGFDYIDIRFDCLEDYLQEHTLEELAGWFKSHHLKPLSYNALCFFNWKKDAAAQKAVFDELDHIIKICNAIDMKLLVAVPTFDIKEHASVDEIKADAVDMLRKMADQCALSGIGISLEFCGAPGCTINRFDTAYDIVTAVDRDNVGLTLDQYHFYAMASSWEALEKSDGKKIFVYHLNDTENLPLGAAYNTDEKRLWPENGCLDHARYTSTLKKIGFDADVCTMEVFRPEYYQLSVDENVRMAAQRTKAFIAKYFGS
ncbi:sugar phosphate isomerase/epimerase family protein [Caproiciproducens sp. R2]|uniref:sugar phosphate isomerase/epimerase family protein n=1 Tax=Caproiciproducens sp. R2 TaxID=3435187 RepID=UPI0040346CCD